jgi:hypothetical protein
MDAEAPAPYCIGESNEENAAALKAWAQTRLLPGRRCRSQRRFLVRENETEAQPFSGITPLPAVFLWVLSGTSAGHLNHYFDLGFRFKLIALQEQRRDSGETRGVT